LFQNDNFSSGESESPRDRKADNSTTNYHTVCPIRMLCHV